MKIRDPLEIGRTPLAIDLSNSSKHLAVATASSSSPSPSPGELQVWDLKTKKKTFATSSGVGERGGEKGGGGDVLCVRFHSSSRHLCCGTSSGRLNLVNLSTNQVTSISSSTSPSTSWPLRHVEFSSVQKILVASVNDAGILDVWDTTRLSSSSAKKSNDGLLVHEALHHAPATSVSFHPTER
jgi:hypothetical protein